MGLGPDACDERVSARREPRLGLERKSGEEYVLVCSLVRIQLDELAITRLLAGARQPSHAICNSHPAATRAKSAAGPRPIFTEAVAEDHLAAYNPA